MGNMKQGRVAWHIYVHVLNSPRVGIARDEPAMRYSCLQGGGHSALSLPHSDRCARQERMMGLIRVYKKVLKETTLFYSGCSRWDQVIKADSPELPF